MNRVFLHGNLQTPIATSLAPRNTKSAKADRKRSKRQEENADWERDAGHMSVPEVKEDEEYPQERPEKCDVTADHGEQASGVQAKSEDLPEEASSVKEIVDVNLTDQQTSSNSCAQ